MGVQGWSTFAKEKQWVPDDTPCCSTSLWRSSPFKGSQVLPQGSSLHIDGNGLVFYLARVAHARVTEQVVGPSEANHSKLAHSFSEAQMQALIPTFLPLTVLQAVTMEFASRLKESKYEVTVYWDGPKRPKYKNLFTRAKREGRRAEQWGNLRTYCENGVVPAGEACVCSLESSFPQNPLASVQVQHTLHSHCKLRRVDCEGEADDALARSSLKDTNPFSFVIGNDSDFSFMKGISYVPLDSLSLPRGDCLLKGIVIRRSDIAESLGFETEQTLIELALALGNDFVPRSKPPDKKSGESIVEAWILFVTDQPCGWTLPARSHHVEIVPGDDKVEVGVEVVKKAMAFCRSWYDLEGWNEADMIASNVESQQDDVIVPQSTTFEPRLPFPLTLEENVDIKGLSLKAVVCRCAEEYADVGVFDDAVVSMYRETEFATDSHEFSTLIRQPWKATAEAVLFGKIASQCVARSLSSPLAVLFPPSSIFDFHTFLQMKNVGNEMESHPPAEASDAVTKPDPPLPKSKTLPIDAHEDLIVSTIRKQRVTIIQGDTGCGKSTRIPVMLLNASPPDSSLKCVKMFISQPRRIAAKALVDRLRAVEPSLKRKFALRLGHGVREYETKDTTTWFVTTGYLVRLLANHPEKFADVSHLVIDEIHERSVDTDILCLLCRRLLKTNSTIRLVLMSATLAAGKFQEYFGVSDPVIKVGAKRFPIEEIFLEDLSSKYSFPHKMTKSFESLVSECNRLQCKTSPSNSYMEKLFQVVASLATTVGKLGSAVLIFVAGMNDIVSVTECIEQLMVPGLVFKCFPVHSDIAFEDQMKVFDDVESNEVKIIIATNAAESSVTLPDCDHVICLGLCKQIVYNKLSHRQMLLPTWISRASSTQRAGRTSRVRPGGRVYRMYTRECFTNYMLEFEPGEILRMPLDSVILMLRQILPEGSVTSALLDCIEPPEIDTIGRSYESLCQSRFITTADETCEITELGEFVTAVGLDLSLGSLMGLGIQFGVGSELIEVAGVLSFPKSPWLQSNPMIHEPTSYNEITRKSYISKCEYDGGLLSEPLAVLNMLWDYKKNGSRFKFCKSNGLHEARTRRVQQGIDNLRQRVANFLKVPVASLTTSLPPRGMNPETIMLVRIVHTWTFHESVIRCRPSEFNGNVATENEYVIGLKRDSDQVQESDLAEILGHGDFKIQATGLREINGSYKWVEDKLTSAQLEETMLSFATETSMQLVWFTDGDTQCFSVESSLLNCSDFAVLAEKLRERLPKVQERVLVETKKRRGKGERSCGKWRFGKTGSKGKEWTSFQSTAETKLSNKKWKSLHEQHKIFAKMHSTGLYCILRHGSACTSSFTVGTAGASLSDVDIADMFFTASSHVKQQRSSSAKVRQQIAFKRAEAQSGSIMKENIPLGARLLSVLASGRRKEHSVLVENDDINLKIKPDYDTTNLARRWKSFPADNAVYVDGNSAVASALPLGGADIQLGICAQTLEVRGGGMKVEGLTLLPQGPLFFLLCRLSFGLISNQQSLDTVDLVEHCKAWVDTYESSFEGDQISDSIKAAIVFHTQCMNMGEELRLFPLKREQLLGVFQPFKDA